MLREESPLGLIAVRETKDVARRAILPRNVHLDPLAGSAVVPELTSRIDTRARCAASACACQESISLGTSSTASASAVRRYRRGRGSAHDWTGLVPVLVLSEILVVSANALLGVEPFLNGLSAVAILLFSFALVGLATGLGARYPRFAAESPTEVAGSYGGVMFMVVAMLIVLLTAVLLGWPASIYLWYQSRGRAMPSQYWRRWPPA